MQYPHLTEDQINQATRAYMMQIQSGFTGRVDYDRSHYAQVRNPNEAIPQSICLPLYPPGSVPQNAIHFTVVIRKLRPEFDFPVKIKMAFSQISAIKG